MTSSADYSATLSPHNRTILLDDLRPPDGFRLDAAVATTFTLGLGAALLPPLAFSSYSFRSSTPDPISVMEAIRAAAGSIDIFCQAGMVGVPRTASSLLAFVEPMVHQVRVPPHGLFHPKVWCVRYTDDDGRFSYRTLVLSRNLTEDRTWDITLRLDSLRIGESPRRANQGLVDLVRSLPTRTIRPLEVGRASRIVTLSHELARVEWEVPEPATSVAFHLYDNGGPSDPPHRPELVVSPFLDDDGLTEALAVDNGCVVVSRPETLERLAPATIELISAYVPDPGFVAEAEPDVPAESGEHAVERPANKATSLLSGLHAKFYVTGAGSAWSRRRLYVGSANATRAAFRGNTELLVELEGHKKHFGREQLLSPEYGFGGLVEEYRPTGGTEPSPEEDAQRELERALRRIASIPHTVWVEPTADKVYNLRVTSADTYSLAVGVSSEIELLTIPGQTRIPETDPVDVRFHSVGTHEVTPFVVIHLRGPHADARTVVVAELIGDPPDRLDTILAKQVDTPEKFLRFLLLLLSLGNSSMFAQLSRSGAGEGIGAITMLSEHGLLEMILHALATKPDVLDDIGSLVERMQRTAAGRQNLPEGFEKLWDQVQIARQLVGDGR